MSLWKAATSREERGSSLQRWFRMRCSEVYPIFLPCFSSSLLSSSCWHHQLLTLREACPNHCSTTQSQLFHLSHSSPAPSSLVCYPSLGFTTATHLLSTHFMCPQRTHDPSRSPPPFLLTIMSPSFSFAYRLLSHSGNICPSWHILPLQCGLPACFAMSVFFPGFKRVFRQDITVTS